MNKELKLIFRNSFISNLIILVYGLVIGQRSVYIASTLGAILSIGNLYWIYKDSQIMVYRKTTSMKSSIASYSKRYIVNGLFLALMMYVDLQWLIAGAMGLLVVKLNILLVMFSHQLNNIVKKLKI